MVSKTIQGIVTNLNLNIALLDTLSHHAKKNLIDISNRSCICSLYLIVGICPPSLITRQLFFVLRRNLEIKSNTSVRTIVVVFSDIVLTMENNIVTHVRRSILMLFEFSIKSLLKHHLCSHLKRTTHHLSLHKKFCSFQVILLTHGLIGCDVRNSTLQCRESTSRIRFSMSLKSYVVSHYTNVVLSLKSSIGHIECRFQIQLGKTVSVSTATCTVREYYILQECSKLLIRKQSGHFHQRVEMLCISILCHN